MGGDQGDNDKQMTRGIFKIKRLGAGRQCWEGAAYKIANNFQLRAALNAISLASSTPTGQYRG